MRGTLWKPLTLKRSHFLTFRFCLFTTFWPNFKKIYPPGAVSFLLLFFNTRSDKFWGKMSFFCLKTNEMYYFVGRKTFLSTKYISFSSNFGRFSVSLARLNLSVSYGGWF